MKGALSAAVCAAFAALMMAQSTAGAQEQPAAAQPAVGDIAPDFTGTGATRYGLLSHPVSLADQRGKTVVVAFFPRARTAG